MERCCRIVLTGGPGGGKTTAADLFRREIGDKVVIVPEAATILYGGGFPRTSDTAVRKASQKAIYYVQKHLEEAQAAHYEHRILLCDRGTVDGAAYWPGSPKYFFKELNTSLENEFKRYDKVLFFETAAVGGVSIEGGNPVRIESAREAIELNNNLKKLWSRHPHFTYIPHQVSFIKKINMALDCLLEIFHNGK